MAWCMMAFKMCTHTIHSHTHITHTHTHTHHTHTHSIPEHVDAKDRVVAIVKYYMSAFHAARKVRTL